MISSISKLSEMSGPIPVHIGLMGHIDHGKTALARVLSEKVSTAGLDKHPQSQQRGITIDLGFTMFNLDGFMVTLVDAPGHADLIRSVVAGAGIIDAAILTIAADEGPKIQTGEHIIVLKSLGIETVIVAITKCDLASESKLNEVEVKARSVMNSAGYHDSAIVRISSKTGEGIDLLRGVLRERVKPRERDSSGSLLLPLDHAFSKKGYGTVVTGTILRGRVSVEDIVEVVPLNKKARIRSIQVFGETKNDAAAGDRVGINIPEINSADLKRGDYVCRNSSLTTATSAFCRIKRVPMYEGTISKRMVLNATIGMPTVTSEIVPYMVDGENRIIQDSTREESFEAALLFQRPLGLEVGMHVILMRSDLPPTKMRIVGSGEIIEVPSSIKLLARRARRGKVYRIREDDTLVEGLASSKIAAEKLIGKTVYAASGASGDIKQTFGTRGVVSVIFDTSVSDLEEVFYIRLVEEEYRFGLR
ncbi:MAG: selenocysteine-specific translation elongation factor [Candidatus Thorarchaeota archaeon]